MAATVFDGRNDRIFASRRVSLYAALLPLVFLAACASPKPPAVSPPVAVTPYEPFAVSKWEMLPDWRTVDLAARVGSLLAKLQRAEEQAGLANGMLARATN